MKHEQFTSLGLIVKEKELVESLGATPLLQLLCYLVCFPQGHFSFSDQLSLSFSHLFDFLRQKVASP